jgi:cerevisin
MSLGGGASRALDDAVNKAVAAGLHFAVAAGMLHPFFILIRDLTIFFTGNDNSDACEYSPAAAEKAVTVGASTLADERAYFSNHGSCVDVFAPGMSFQGLDQP